MAINGYSSSAVRPSPLLINSTNVWHELADNLAAAAAGNVNNGSVLMSPQALFSANFDKTSSLLGQNSSSATKSGVNASLFNFEIDNSNNKHNNNIADKHGSSGTQQRQQNLLAMLPLNYLLLNDDDEKSRRRQRRAERRAVPDERKDERYFQRRVRNNYAAKKSRDTRKAREDDISHRAERLERNNAILRAQVATLREEALSLRDLIDRKYKDKKAIAAKNLLLPSSSSLECTFASTILAAAPAANTTSSLQTSPTSPLAPANVRHLLGYNISIKSANSRSHGGGAGNQQNEINSLISCASHNMLTPPVGTSKTAAS